MKGVGSDGAWQVGKEETWDTAWETKDECESMWYTKEEPTCEQLEHQTWDAAWETKEECESMWYAKEEPKCDELEHRANESRVPGEQMWDANEEPEGEVPEHHDWDERAAQPVMPKVELGSGGPTSTKTECSWGPDVGWRVAEVSGLLVAMPEAALSSSNMTFEGQHPKTAVSDFLKRYCGRSICKDDFYFTCEHHGEGFVATLKAPCFNAEAYTGSANPTAKGAEASAAERFLQDPDVLHAAANPPESMRSIKRQMKSDPVVAKRHKQQGRFHQLRHERYNRQADDGCRNAIWDGRA
ncbi:unnamed protein product [Symbiodinium sp. CCMP2592]|nr:unnamed protein product [Symbiodinium sp. CCMP2592]